MYSEGRSIPIPKKEIDTVKKEAFINEGEIKNGQSAERQEAENKAATHNEIRAAEAQKIEDQEKANRIRRELGIPEQKIEMANNNFEGENPLDVYKRELQVITEKLKDNQKDDTISLVYEQLIGGASFHYIKEMSKEMIRQTLENIDQTARGNLRIYKGTEKPRKEDFENNGDYEEELREYIEKLNSEIKELSGQPEFSVSAYEGAIDYVNKLKLPENVIDYSPREEYEKNAESVIDPIIEKLRSKIKNQKHDEFPARVKDGELFDAHGITKGGLEYQLRNLIALLKIGINPYKKSLATAAYNSENNPWASGGAYKNGEFVLLGRKKESLVDDDGKLRAETILVGDSCYGIVDELREMFPNTNFIRRADTKKFFDEYGD